MIYTLIRIAFALLLTIPVFLIYSAYYLIIIFLCHFIAKNIFKFHGIKKVLYFKPFYILIFIILFVIMIYPVNYKGVEGIITNNDGPIVGMEVTRIISYLDKKDVAVSDKDGKIIFPEQRSLIRPLEHIDDEQYFVKYKTDLHFGLNMPYFEPKIIETDYSSDELPNKFKINLDSLYLFYQEIPIN